LELVYIAEGEMNACVDGKWITARKNDLLIVPSFSLHRYDSPNSNSVIILIIPLDYISSFPNRISGVKYLDILLSACAETSKIAYCLETLLENSDQNAEPYLIRGQIYSILGILISKFTDEGKPRKIDASCVKEVLDYIVNNYRRRLSLKNISKSLGYSESHISHIFNRVVGCSIPEYIGSLRARTAGVLLLESKKPLADIAIDAGFNSMRSFYRTFYKCFGLTPTKFLELNRDELQVLMESTDNYRTVWLDINT
jgi:AraC-like DNA-binding protein